MSDANPAGPVVHLIPVTFDLSSVTVTLGYSTVALKPGDRVGWEFFGLPTGWSPWIEFHSETDGGSSFLGPFASLTQTSASLLGTCREDSELAGKEFSYRISAQKGVGVGWESGITVVNSSAALLKINSAETVSGHRFTVRPSGNELSVSPKAVTLGYGDTVEWVFEDIDDASTWRPIVNFTRYVGKGEVPNDYLGPFTVLETEAGRVYGMGNSRVNGEYSFQVSVVKVGTGEILWMSSGDPVIDNRGGVVDPPGGG